MMEKIEIDIQTLSRLIGKENSILIRFLKIYETEFNNAIIKMKSAIDNGDFNMLSITAHSLKSQSKYLSIQPIVDLTFQLEQIADSKGSLEQINELLAQLIAYEPQVYEQIKNLIETLERT